jgi:hypothetical protein
MRTSAAVLVVALFAAAPRVWLGAQPAVDPARVVFEMQDALGMLRGLQQEDSVNRIEYWGTDGAIAARGRTSRLTNFKVSINYSIPGMRVDLTHDGGREIHVVAGTAAWNEETPGGKATPMAAAAADRLLEIWLTPIGLAKAAKAAGGNTRVAMENGAPVLTFPAAGATVKASLNKLYEPEQVEARAGSTLIQISYSDYGDWNDDAKADVFLPRHILQKQSGATTLELVVTNTNTYNPYVIMPVPENIGRRP